MKKITYYLDSLIIFIGSMVAFTYGLFGRELIGFETRFGLFAKEMLNSGPGFFPTTYGLPYPDYPALHTCLIALCSLPFGHLTTLSAILPSAIACSLTLVFIYRLLVVFDRTWALAAILLSFLTFQFLDAGRSLTMDSLVMLMSVWAFYVANRFAQMGKMSGLVKLALPLVIGFAIRGPIGLVLPAGIVCVTLWSQQGFKAAWYLGLKMLALLAVLLAALLIAANHVGGISFVHQVLQMQIVGRMADSTNHYQTLAYFSEAFANYALGFELALLTVLFFYQAIIKALTPETQLLRQCLLWLLVVMIGMSIPAVRKIRYILPIVPAVLILASFWWYQTNQNALKCKAVKVFNYLFLALPFLSLALITAFIVVTHLKALDVNAHYFSAYFLLTLLAAGSACLLWQQSPCLTQPLRVLGVGAASVWVVLVFVIGPVNVSLNRVKPFVDKVSMALSPGEHLAFLNMDPDGEAIQWMLATDSTLPPLFVQSLTDPRVAHTLVMTTQQDFAKLFAENDRLHIVQQGRLGHRTMVVFRPLAVNNV